MSERKERKAPKLLNREPLLPSYFKGRVGLRTGDPFTEVRLEVIKTREGVSRIWIKGRRTPFKVDSTIPHSECAVLSIFINYWLGQQLFSKLPSSIEEIKKTLAAWASLELWAPSSIGDCYTLIKNLG